MRYIEIIKVAVAPELGKPLIPYSTSDFMREHVLPRLEWRASNELMQTLLELIEAFENKKLGEVVALQDQQHERLARVAVLPGQGLRTDLVGPFTRLMLSITSAPNKPPEGWQEVQPPTNGSTAATA